MFSKWSPRATSVVQLGWLLVLSSPVSAEDWPMWRHDASRSAVTSQELPSQLHPQWTIQLPPLETAWPDQAKMVFDRQYEPVVLGERLFVGSSRNDCVTAYSTRTGDHEWTHFADGPVRFAPVAHRGKVYFVSDDGYLYCVNAQDGTLLWKVRGGPSDRKILGNERLISTWPARGGPVLADSTVYFAASIWPFMGIFIHAVDAEAGRRIWLNDGDSANYIIQPHGAYSFAGITPQGALCVAGDKLLVPGGRTVPACLDRRTGKQLYFQHGRRAGGTDVFANGEVFVNNGEVCDLETGDNRGMFRGPLAMGEDAVFVAERDSIRAFATPLLKQVERKDLRGRTSLATVLNTDPIFSIDGAAVDEIIRVGPRLYGAKDDRIFAIDLPTEARKADSQRPKISWQTQVTGKVVRLLAADDRLFAVTLEGGIHCFGADPTEPRQHAIAERPIARSDSQRNRARAILDQSEVRSGYCVLWGIGDGGLAAEMIAASDLFVIAFDPDPEKVAIARQRFADAGLYGRRISIHAGDPRTAELPPYLARLMVATESDATWLTADESSLANMYAALRPYGGVTCFDYPTNVRATIADTVDKLQLAQGRVRLQSDRLLLTRVGALPGSDNWTHEHADAANTRVSHDQLVKAPLGVLWFGGPSHDSILPRHGHGPQPQVVDGRMIIEGPDVIRCLDIYTGQLLWERSLPGVGELYDNTAHHSGANGTGANYISMPDGIYVLYGQVCLCLDPDSGETKKEFQLPVDVNSTDRQAASLCYINVVDDYLVLGVDTSNDDAARLYEDYISCQRLAVLNRRDGATLWSIDAQFQFRNNAICAGGGRLYCVDLLSDFETARLRRRGETPSQPSRLMAIELQTGRELWSTDEGVFGTWLSYSAAHDMLFESGRPGRDVLRGEPNGIRAYRASDGKFAWKSDERGPAMVHGDRILNESGQGFDLLTGKPLTSTNPINGQLQPWGWKRNYGCNTPQASEHLLVFRSGAAGFYDLERDGGTGNLGGFRSSCTNNLIIAGGVLTAPDYTRTCVCAYQNQTSLALVHMPQAEYWTFNGSDFDSGRRVQQLGINFGAPGDRRANNGTLWIDFPSVGGDSPKLPVQLTGDALRYVRHHASSITSENTSELAWVAASAAIGVRQIDIPLGTAEPNGPRVYRVRLHFAELEGLASGERRFDVTIDGRLTEQDFDIAQAAAGTNRSVVREYLVPAVDSTMTITLTPKSGEPLVCGVELLAEPGREPAGR